MGRTAAGEPAILFCELILRVSLLVSAATDDKNQFEFNWLSD
jgi:hypothetical protein